MAAIDGHTNGVALTNGNGIHHDGPLDASPSSFDSSLVRNYLVSLLPALLGAAPDDLWSLFEDDFEERVGRFASEGNGVMYVTKIKHEFEGASCGILYVPTAEHAPLR
jgi:hypothetical protein